MLFWPDLKFHVILKFWGFFCFSDLLLLWPLFWPLLALDCPDVWHLCSSLLFHMHPDSATCVPNRPYHPLSECGFLRRLLIWLEPGCNSHLKSTKVKQIKLLISFDKLSHHSSTFPTSTDLSRHWHGLLPTRVAPQFVVSDTEADPLVLYVVTAAAEGVWVLPGALLFPSLAPCFCPSCWLFQML